MFLRMDAHSEREIHRGPSIFYREVLCMYRTRKQSAGGLIQKRKNTRRQWHSAKENSTLYMVTGIKYLVYLDSVVIFERVNCVVYPVCKCSCFSLWGKCELAPKHKTTMLVSPSPPQAMPVSPYINFLYVQTNSKLMLELKEKDKNSNTGTLYSPTEATESSMRSEE